MLVECVKLNILTLNYNMTILYKYPPVIYLSTTAAMMMMLKTNSSTVIKMMMMVISTEMLWIVTKLWYRLKISK